MYKPKPFALLFLLFPIIVFANDYDKAWEALHKNNRSEAMVYLQKAMNDPATAIDASLTYIYLQTFNGKEQGNKQFYEKVLTSAKDISPYIFSLWFNESVAGNYGKKSVAEQLSLLNEIFKRKDINGSLKSAAHYMMSLHFLHSNDFEKAKVEWDQVGGISNWQLVGPFENLSGTGYDKSFGPLEHPGKSDFKSVSGAAIQWFTPAKMNEDAWVFLQSHISNRTAIVYAQTFIYAPADMDVVVNAGVNGSIKVWVNDGLKIAEKHERVTELDYYKNYCSLKKGYNRVLVQVGFTDNSIPNFIIRFTDKNGITVPGLRVSAELQAYPKEADKQEVSMLKHFAEAYFEEKIKAEPTNWINYILLSQTYLRNQKTFEARKVIQKALKANQDNSLLHFELIQCLLKDQNRTLLSQEVEWLKENDSKSLLGYSLRMENLIDEEKYDEALVILNEKAQAFGEDEDIINDRIRISRLQGKTEETVKMIQSAYQKYPENLTFLRMMFNLNKDSYKNGEEAIKVYEKYLKNNFDYSIYKSLGEEYIEQGKKDKGVKILEDIQKKFPYDADFLATLATYYYQQQNYNKSLEYAEMSLQLAPYTSTYWDNKAVILEQLGKSADAGNNYKKALYYDPQGYDTRKKLRTIENKQDLYKTFPERDLYDLIKKAGPISPDYDYSYLLDEKQVIIYAESAVEEYITYVIKINTTNGIDKWKDSYIPYNQYTQSLLIEKAEVIKKNGSKLQAEKNNNEFVFTSLEIGDAIVIKYRLQNYVSGRLAKEFYDHHTFESFNPTGEIKYSLLAPKDLSFEYKMENSSIKPQVTEIDGYKLYSWEVKNLPGVKDEPYMPNLTDVGATLHISTIKSWTDVAKWYSDISYVKEGNDYELKEVYDELFPVKSQMSEIEKAKRIYNYIEKNIRYSSVSFRQSAFVPQKASSVLNTRLGDCKDLSSLFVSLASMAGLDARLVLVETRNNGTSEMMLPSVEFNHCIVLLKADGKEYYLELTDNDLPFASLPYNLPGASSLIIPRQGEAGFVGALKPIVGTNRTKEGVKRTIDMSADGLDLNVGVVVENSGALTSNVRDKYGDLTDEKLVEEMEKAVSRNFKNPVKVQTVSFVGLDTLTDKVQYKFSYKVKDEIIEVGDMKMFKVPFSDVIATSDNFIKDTRTFPIEYWKYETVDTYETIVNIAIPAGKKLVDIPKSQELKFNKNIYSITYQQKPNGSLVITRKASLVRENIAPADYKAFREFLNSIVKIEAKYIAFK